MSEETPDDDLVTQVFQQVRATAKRRTGTLPEIGRQGASVTPRRSQPKPLAAIEEEERTLIPGFRQLHQLSKQEQRSVGKHTYGATGPDGRRARRSYDVPRFGAVVGKEIVNRGWEEDLAKGWVLNHWEDLVGEKIAQHTRVEMIKEKTVFVSTDSTAWATNLKYMQKTILQAIAAKIGPNLVEELKIFPPKAPSWRKGPLHVKGRGPRDTYG